MEDSQTYNFTVKSSIKDYDVVFDSVYNTKHTYGDIIVVSKFIYDKFFSNDDPKHYYIIEDSEKTKEYNFGYKMIQDLVNMGFKRNNKLIAIGGGVIQDITGFIASMLYRGVEWQFYPTTLLSQGDSCIGSKTSINVGELKNIVGGFYPPSKVVIDTGFLKTLPESQIMSGIGEMAHYFLIDGRKSFEYFKNRTDDYDDLIHKSLMIKKKMIEIDEFDRKERKVFNYGHTFGHAIESMTNYEVPHGIAVCFGMSIANYVSLRLGYISMEEFNEMEEVLNPIYSYIKLPDFNVDEYIEVLKKDKKNIGDNLGLILTKGLGNMFLEQTPVDKVYNDIKYYINLL